MEPPMRQGVVLENVHVDMLEILGGLVGAGYLLDALYTNGGIEVKGDVDTFDEGKTCFHFCESIPYIELAVN